MMASKYTRDFLLVVTSYCLSRREVNLNANYVEGKGGSLLAAESHTSSKDLVFSMCKSISIANGIMECTCYWDEV